MDMIKEQEILKICLQYLGWKKIFCYRNNTGGLPIQNSQGRKSFIRFGFPGSPDLVAVIKGKYVGIEVKVEKGKQSLAQEEFQNRLEEAGGVYWLIHSVEELQKYVEEYLKNH